MKVFRVSGILISSLIFCVSVAWTDQATVFFEGFESGVLSNCWSTYSDTQGRIQIASSYAPYGGSSYHVTLDDTQSDETFSLNELILTVDLSGQSNLWLSFYQKSFFDEDHSMPDTFSGHDNSDGVAISVDGGINWYKAQGLTSSDGTSETYTEFRVNLDELCAAYGLSYVSDFKIKFQQYDDSPIEEDGFAFDSIVIAVKDYAHEADLGLNLSESLYYPMDGNYGYVHLTVSNAGPDKAEDVVLSGSIGNYVTIVETSHDCEVSRDGHFLTYEKSEMMAGDSFGIMVGIQATGTAQNVSTFQVSSLQEDPYSLNNARSGYVWLDTRQNLQWMYDPMMMDPDWSTLDVDLDVEIVPVDMEVSLTNKVVSYEIRVSNHYYPFYAPEHVNVLHAFSDNVEFVSCSGSSTYESGLLHLSFYYLSSSDSETVQLRLKDLDDPDITLRSYIGSGFIDSVPDNNYCETNYTVSLVGTSCDINWEQVFAGVVGDGYMPLAYLGGEDLTGPAFSDIDGDGDLDAVVGVSGAVFTNGLVLYRNIGTMEHPEWELPCSFLNISKLAVKPVFCDIDADGDDDLFVGEDYGRLYMSENIGSAIAPEWDNFQLMDFVDLDDDTAPAFYDIDADGDQELFVGRLLAFSNSFAITYYENSGSSNSPVWEAGLDYLEYEEEVGEDYFVPVFHDQDGDGDADLIVGNYNGTLLYFENTGTISQAQWASPQKQFQAIDVGNWSSPTFADIDADGDDDLIIGSRLGSVYLYEAQAAGTYVASGELFPVLDVGRWSAAAFCDIDADGDQDLFMREEYNSYFLENKGDRFSPQWMGPTFASFNCWGMDFCDIDADGDEDIFCGTSWNGLAMLENTGTCYEAAWASETTLVNRASAGDKIVPALCDIDADGDYDLFFGKKYGTISFYENIGTISNAVWSKITDNYNLINTIDWYDDGYSSPAFADVDMDGDYDLFVGQYDRWIHPMDSQGGLVFYQNIGTASNAVWADGVEHYGDFAVGSYTRPALCDIDGDHDPDLFVANMGGGLMQWRNLSAHLTISPAKKTINTEESIQFYVDEYSSNLVWQLSHNESGGAIDPVTGYYTAGVQGGVDVVEAVHSSGLMGVAAVIVNQDSMNNDYSAIIIAGRNNTNPYDPVWTATDYLADTAYSLLRYKGYPKSSIQYLSPVLSEDVDGNGIMDDIDAESTLSNAQEVFTNYVAGASNLFVYLVDHGSSEDGGYMRLSPTEVLSASNLSVWLDDLQNTYQMDVTVVLDFCYAGCFLPTLAYTGTAQRTVIAAASSNEPAYFVAGGLVSFSEAFFNAMMQGFNVDEAFSLARGAMSDYQSAWLDDDKDGTYDKDVDGANSSYGIGVTTVAGQDIPQIASIASNQTLSGNTAATVWADEVTASYPIDRVWCVVVPPNHNPDPDNPVVDLPEIELYSVGSQYQASYQGFTEPGTYKIIYYASDVLGGVSLPKYGYVNQGGVDEKVILLAGGSTNDTYYATINNMAENAYNTFLIRQISSSNIYYMNDNAMVEGVDSTPSTNALYDAITNWADTADSLTVYLIGESTNIVNGSLTNHCLVVNDNEYIDAPTLDAWLDAYQTSNQPCIVVMDFPGSVALGD